MKNNQHYDTVIVDNGGTTEVWTTIGGIILGITVAIAVVTIAVDSLVQLISMMATTAVSSIMAALSATGLAGNSFTLAFVSLITITVIAGVYTIKMGHQDKTNN